MAGPWYIVVSTSEIDIDATYKTRTTGMIGFGMPPLTHNISGQALTPGALFQDLKVAPRVLQLRVSCRDTSLAAYHSIRKDLLDAVKPNFGGTLTPVELRYDGAGTKVYIKGYYDGGLEGNRGPGCRAPEDITMRFICYDPFWYAMSATTVALDGNATIANADYILRRNSGVWANLSTDFNDLVYALCEATGNVIYIGGAFSDVGDADGDGLMVWPPTSAILSKVGTGLGAGACYALAKNIAEHVYLGGSFTNIGDANGDRVVRWTGSTWASVGTGISNGTVRALVFGHDGTLYAGGSFTDFVDANGDYITKWNGTAWSSLGTGMNNIVYALAVGPDGTLYAAGQFTTAGGAAAVGIAKWNGTAWSAVGSGVGLGGGAIAYALAVGLDGTLYIGGDFTTVDGVSAPYIARWNGQQWSGLSTGMNGIVYALAVAANGELYAGGAFTTAGEISATNMLAVWNGTSWTHVPVTLPGTPSVRALLTTGNDLYVATGSAGSAYAAAQTTVTNGGTAAAYPTITINRAGGTTARVEYLRNETTGQTLYLNYSLLNGETLTIALTPGAKAITSDLFGNVIGRALLPNSDFAKWCLQPGANIISLYVSEAGSPTVTASCVFTASHWSVDGVAS